MKNEPFTPQEKKIMDLLVQAHNEFTKLDKSHVSEPHEWTTAIHQAQHILLARVVRRDYPGEFNVSGK